jgi:hypothetical protein
MKIFHCSHCQQLVFFENVRCLNCDHALAFLPDVADMASLEPAGDKLWRSPTPSAQGQTYRLCTNYSEANVCNWAVPAADPNPLCSSCRLTRVIPDLSKPGNKEAWYRLEVAKRRLVHTLLALRLPILNKTDDPTNGLAYEFLADTKGKDGAVKAVLTGHNDGVITVNVAEANDAEREKRRAQLHEPYRTLLGHFRHEIGHYYWDRLIRDRDRLEAFRTYFGDERRDYGEALEQHYKQGPPADWQERFVSAYASSHAWEDWAETWAHYLHMTDVLETSAACGLALQPRRDDEPALRTDKRLHAGIPKTFERLIDAWVPLTYLLNELNRGMGLPDGYPFVLSPAVQGKLQFIHETVETA